MNNNLKNIICWGLICCCLAYPAISVLGGLNGYFEKHPDELPRQIQGYIEMSNPDTIVAPASGASINMVAPSNFTISSGDPYKW